MNAENCPFHCQRLQLGFYALLQFVSGFLTPLGKLIGQRFVRLRQLFTPLFHRRAALCSVFGGGDVAAHLCKEGEDLLHRRAVFAFQLVDYRKTALDLLQARGIGFDMAQVVAQRSGGFGYCYPGRLQSVGHATQALIDAAKFFQTLHRQTHLGVRGLRPIVQRGIGDVCALQQPRDVLLNAALLLEAYIFAGFKTGRVDFIALEVPQIEQAEFFLFGLLQLLKFTCALPPLPVNGADLIQKRLRRAKLIDDFELSSRRKRAAADRAGHEYRQDGARALVTTPRLPDGWR